MRKTVRAFARLCRRKARAVRVPRRVKRRLVAHALLGASFGVWAAMPGAPRPIPPKKAPPVSREFLQHNAAPLPPDFWYTPRPVIGETVTDLTRDNWASEDGAPPKKRNKKR